MKVIVLLLQPPVCVLNTGKFEYNKHINTLKKSTHVEHPIDY